MSKVQKILAVQAETMLVITLMAALKQEGLQDDEFDVAMNHFLDANKNLGNVLARVVKTSNERKPMFPNGYNAELTDRKIALLSNECGKLHCIKAVRERTGYSLKESKDIVEAYMRKHNIPDSYHASQERV